MSTKKLVVVRGGSKRIAQADFFSCFKKFEIKFLADLKFKPWFLIDPIKLIQGKTSHRSWNKVIGLEKYLKEVDVVNTLEMVYFFSAQAAGLAQKHKKLMTTTIWTSFPHPSWFIPPYCFNVRKTLKLTDLFLAKSNRAAENYLRFLKVPEKKIKVIFPGVNLKRFYPPKRKTWQGIRVLFVGQLVESKGLDDLLAVFPKLSRQFSKLELWICGQGKLEDRLNQASREWPIKYLGFVDYLKMPDIYRSVDIFIMPSKDVYHLGIKFGEEFFSYVLLEAMASGLPIITSRCGGIEEEVGKENLLIRQGDRKAILKALVGLVSDQEARKQLGRKNRKRAKKLFDLKKQARKTEEAILKFL
ncbi:glycosyltransferase family 4 protein [Patescibacteria group bacterium]